MCSHEEIMFTMFAHIVGIGIFALLVQEINNLKLLTGLENVDAKNAKDSLLLKMTANSIPKKLKSDVIAFLDYQAVTWQVSLPSEFAAHHFSSTAVAPCVMMGLALCLQAHAFDRGEKNFRKLSKPLQVKLFKTVYSPILQVLPLLKAPDNSHNEVKLKQIFDDIDTDGEGQLDDSELKELMLSLGVDMNHQEVLAVLLEMDTDNTGSVDFPNFKGWWQRKFTATLAIQQCPRMQPYLPRIVSCAVTN